jgi:hypothetical protein
MGAFNGEVATVIAQMLSGRHVAAYPPGRVHRAVSLDQNRNRQPRGTEMGRQISVVLYVVAMAAVIVGIDFVFFRNRFWERLIVNIGIVLVFAAFYLRFLKERWR